MSADPNKIHTETSKSRKRKCMSPLFLEVSDRDQTDLNIKEDEGAQHTKKKAKISHTGPSKSQSNAKKQEKNSNNSSNDIEMKQEKESRVLTRSQSKSTQNKQISTQQDNSPTNMGKRRLTRSQSKSLLAARNLNSSSSSSSNNSNNSNNSSSVLSEQTFQPQTNPQKPVTSKKAPDPITTVNMKDNPKFVLFLNKLQAFRNFSPLQRNHYNTLFDRINLNTDGSVDYCFHENKQKNPPVRPLKFRVLPAENVDGYTIYLINSKGNVKEKPLILGKHYDFRNDEFVFRPNAHDPVVVFGTGIGSQGVEDLYDLTPTQTPPLDTFDMDTKKDGENTLDLKTQKEKMQKPMAPQTTQTQSVCQANQLLIAPKPLKPSPLTLGFDNLVQSPTPNRSRLVSPPPPKMTSPSPSYSPSKQPGFVSIAMSEHHKLNLAKAHQSTNSNNSSSSHTSMDIATSPPTTQLGAGTSRMTRSKSGMKSKTNSSS